MRELRATNEEQALQLLRIVNNAREKLQQDAYLGGDDKITRYQRWGTCEQFVMKTDDHIGETTLREQAHITLQNRAKSEGGRITSEYFTDNGDYLITLVDGTDEGFTFNTKTMGLFTGKANGRRVIIVDEASLVEKTKRNYANGKLKGLMRDWHENGQQSREANFINGEHDGLARSWHKNGQLALEENYANGKLEGLIRAWHENGQQFH